MISLIDHRATTILNYLPATEAEQLLQRLPTETAAKLRDEAASAELALDANVHLTLAQFVDELGGGNATARDVWGQLAKYDADRLTAALSSETLQVRATVLLQLPAVLAAEILTQFPDAEQDMIAQRMAVSTVVTSEALEILGESLIGALHELRAV